MTDDFHRATVVGSGAMATLCALLLATGSRRVAILGRASHRLDAFRRDRENRPYLPGRPLPENCDVTDDPDQALAGADLIISAIPCQSLRDVWTKLAPQTPPTSPIVSVTKGVEIGALLRPTEIIRDCLSQISSENPLAALSGPSLADEIAAGLPAAVVLACPDQPLAERIQRALSSESFRVYTNPDIIGVELAGAVKNIIGIAAGIAEGLQMGNNAKASLLTRGLVEITRLGVAMGANPDTFSGLAGIGDLITTCYSTLSRNHTAGEKIGRGLPLQKVIETSHGVIEGVDTTRSVIQLAARHRVEMPITEAVHRILFDNVPPQKAIQSLMLRHLKPENRV